MKVPMTEERLYIAARVLCELRGVDPKEMILTRATMQTPTHDHSKNIERMVWRNAIDVAKEELGIFVQVLTAVEHSYELLPLTDAEKITTK